jgi:hypothetical protein
MTRTFVPPGYKLLSDVRSVTDADTLRGQLAIGERTASKIRDGELDEIHRNKWIAESGEAMLECGYWVAGGFCHYTNGWNPRDPITTKYPIVVAIAKPTSSAVQLRQEESVPPDQGGPPKRRRSPLRDRVKEEMRKAGWQTVEGMLEKTMEEQFKASRDVCRTARNELKSEFVGRQKTTNDK